jgi:hypothetical protein
MSRSSLPPRAFQRRQRLQVEHAAHAIAVTRGNRALVHGDLAQQARVDEAEHAAIAGHVPRLSQRETVEQDQRLLRAAAADVEAAGEIALRDARHARERDQRILAEHGLRAETRRGIDQRVLRALQPEGMALTVDDRLGRQRQRFRGRGRGPRGAGRRRGRRCGRRCRGRWRARRVCHGVERGAHGQHGQAMGREDVARQRER